MAKVAGAPFKICDHSVEWRPLETKVPTICIQESKECIIKWVSSRFNAYSIAQMFKNTVGFEHRKVKKEDLSNEIPCRTFLKRYDTQKPDVYVRGLDCVKFRRAKLPENALFSD